MSGVKITYLGDELFQIETDTFRKFHMSKNELLELRELITAKFPAEIITETAQKTLREAIMQNPSLIRRECSDCDGLPGSCHMNCGPSIKRGDFVEATVTVKTDPDTGTYYPAAVKEAYQRSPEEIARFNTEISRSFATRFREFERSEIDKETEQALQDFAGLYRLCKKRGMIE